MMQRKPFFVVRPAPNSFRRSLPSEVLTAVKPTQSKPANEDVRLFLLSFSAFFCRNFDIHLVTPLRGR
jgi:hypothetical protein